MLDARKSWKPPRNGMPRIFTTRQPPALGAVIHRNLLQQHHAMR